MAGLPAEFHPALGRDARRAAGLVREADRAVSAVWLSLVGGLALAFLLLFQSAGLAATMVWANAAGLGLCALRGFGRYLGCTLGARRIAADWRPRGVVFLPGGDGLVEYEDTVHDPASREDAR